MAHVISGGVSRATAAPWPLNHRRLRYEHNISRFRRPTKGVRTEVSVEKTDIIAFVSFLGLTPFEVAEALGTTTPKVKSWLRDTERMPERKMELLKRLIGRKSLEVPEVTTRIVYLDRASGYLNADLPNVRCQDFRSLRDALAWLDINAEIGTFSVLIGEPTHFEVFSSEHWVSSKEVTEKMQ